MNSETFQEERSRAASLADRTLRWVGRSVGRTALMEAAWDSERYSEAKGFPHDKKEFHSLFSLPAALFFPLTTGVHQSRWGEYGFGVGKGLQLAAFAIDSAALGGFQIALPVLGTVPWFTIYRPLASAAAEILPDRKINRDVRHPKFFLGRRG